MRGCVVKDCHERVHYESIALKGCGRVLFSTASDSVL